MNYRSFLFIMLLCCCHHDLSAQLVCSQGIYYNAIADNEVEVYKAYNFPQIVIPESISDDHQSWKVVGLADGCFSLCYLLERVSLPSTLRFIGSKAFKDCKFLKEMHVASLTPPEVAYDFAEKTNGHPAIVVPGNGSAYYRHEIWGKFKITTRNPHRKK